MICGPKKLQRALAKVGAGAGCVWELAGFEGLGLWFWVGAVGTASSAGGSGGRAVCAPCPGEGTALPSPTAGGFSSSPVPTHEPLQARGCRPRLGCTADVVSCHTAGPFPALILSRAPSRRYNAAFQSPVPRRAGKITHIAGKGWGCAEGRLSP